METAVYDINIGLLNSTGDTRGHPLYFNKPGDCENNSMTMMIDGMMED